MPTQYQKEDDYTLLVTNTLPTGGTMTRFFNFAAQQVTTIFREKAELQGEIRAGYSDGGVGISKAVALSAQMHVQKFSDFDSPAELRFLRTELIKRDGHPPEIETLDKPRAPVAKLG